MCEATRSAAADTACLDCGSAAKTLVGACIGRLSAAAETGRAHWPWQLPVSCWGEVLPTVADEAGRALGPMLPASTRELWRFFVLRDRVLRSSTGSARFAEIGLRMLDWRLSPPLRPLSLSLLDAASMQRTMGHDAWTCFVQLAFTRFICPCRTPGRNGAVLSCACALVLSGDALSDRAGRGSASMYA